MPLSARLSHTGHDHAKRARAIGIRHRSEQGIDGWAARVFRWTLIGLDNDSRAHSLYDHVIVAGRQPGLAGHHHVTGTRFVNRNLCFTR